MAVEGLGATVDGDAAEVEEYPEFNLHVGNAALWGCYRSKLLWQSENVWSHIEQTEWVD